MKQITIPREGQNCQLAQLRELGESMSTAEKVWQRRLRAKRIARHGMQYCQRWLAELSAPRQVMSPAHTTVMPVELQPGDLVRVRSRLEIEQTLDRRGKLAHCGFMEEMWQYCGSTHRVLKRVEQFLDERDLRIHKVRHIVLLDGVICQGTFDYGRCDRACFFFWREEWLEKME